MHVVWGIPKNASSPAVLVTAYKPDISIWKDNFMERRKWKASASALKLRQAAKAAW